MNSPGETAPGAFDDSQDFDRNDVVGMVKADSDAFDKIPIWNDYGDEDPFRVYDEGFDEILEADGSDLSAHSWHGGHDSAYWNQHWPAYLAFYANALAHWHLAAMLSAAPESTGPRAATG